MLTVYGIETAKNYGYEFFLLRCNSAYRLRYWNSNIPLTGRLEMLALQQCLPFTVLKLTSNTTSTCTTISSCNSAYRLRYWNKYLESESPDIFKLQQCLPFTVLKLEGFSEFTFRYFRCCNSAYRLRYWNAILKWNTLSISVGLQQCLPFTVLKHTFWYYDIEATQFSCNSTYRLRYAQKGARQQRSKATMRAAHLKYLNEVKVKQR